ncbi:hypothetical protein HDU83_008248 [Entophlyctis luteolus]|nr:hypothetical protein HDU83_008248 [Entophlyctis luteolus]
MMVFPIYGASVAGYKQEIQYAQTMGIDGFTLEIISPFTSFQSQLDMMYEAAKELNNGFWLCLSFDMTSDFSASEIVSAVSRYASHPNQYFISSGNTRKVFVTTFGGESTTFGYPDVPSGWINGVLNPLAAAGTPIYFVPNFWVTYDASVFSQNNYLNGIANWMSYSNIGTSFDIPLQNAALVIDATYMAPVTPWFYKHLSVANWYQGDYDIVGRWMDIISVNPMMVQLVTWNDFSESTYLGSYAANIWNLGDGTHKSVNDHEAFGVLSSFFISWYKNGIQPAITDDKVFFWFRTHSSTAVASNDPLGLPEWRALPYAVPLPDRIYGVVLLSAAATVTVTSGGIPTVFSLSQGVQTLPYVAFNQGTQAVSISRNGVVVKNVVASKPINNAITVYDFNAFAAYG